MKYTAEDIEKNNTKSKLWICIDSKVYDVTSFYEDVAGADATDNFRDIGHSEYAKEIMEKYYIGDLEGPPPKRKVENYTAVEMGQN
ncbi:Cytochrome b5 isoform B [Zancudomyces culisetae]|uniref:Cytochrome b5 isoform B n=1 Tax=Zancudomyces culisetae TaxID=1213189 RepID=A0A1R1PL33_ZANCU|nr:Cytochrome b5 isoform B [Zancudomyces culisetae]|eukprot:OMH81633.1 Cytochrome b5 isoform B [Zancudomyces culisetae]